MAKIGVPEFKRDPVRSLTRWRIRSMRQARTACTLLAFRRYAFGEGRLSKGAGVQFTVSIDIRTDSHHVSRFEIIDNSQRRRRSDEEKQRIVEGSFLGAAGGEGTEARDLQAAVIRLAQGVSRAPPRP